MDFELYNEIYDNSEREIQEIEQTPEYMAYLWEKEPNASPVIFGDYIQYDEGYY